MFDNVRFRHAVNFFILTYKKFALFSFLHLIKGFYYVTKSAINNY